MNDPYQLFARNRPLRVAFLVNPRKTNDEVIDAIVDYCLYRWGGRLNPIVFTNGKTFQKEWWDFLKKYDPDAVISFVKLDEKLIREIDHRISPIILDYTGEEHLHIQRHLDGLLMLPHDDYNGRRGVPTKLAVFRTNQNTDTCVSSFLHRNFGVFDNQGWTERALQMITLKTVFEVNGQAGLAHALTTIGNERREHWMYPTEYLSLWTPMPDTQYDENHRCFCVIIGDTFKEFAYYWNRQLAVESYKRSSFNQLLVPTAFAENEEMQAAIQTWLYKQAPWDGGPTKIRFVSYSHTLQELEQFAQKMTPRLNMYSRCEVLKSPLIPALNEFHIFQENDQHYTALEETQVFSLNGPEDMFRVQEPENIKPFRWGKWMVDLKIEYKPQNYKHNVIGRDSFWKLPRHRAILQHMFRNHAARIVGSRMPSLLAGQENKAFTIEVPRENDIFFCIACQDAHYDFDDMRRNLKFKKFSDIATSQQGKNLRGLFGLFDNNFTNANWIFSEPFWMEVFDSYCPLESKSQTDLEALVKKALGPAQTVIVNTSIIEKVAAICHRYFKGRTEVEITKSHDDLEELCDKQFKTLKGKQSPRKRKKAMARMYDGELEYLVEKNILLMGLYPKCPNCGKKNWYLLDEAKKQSDCKHCLATFQLSPNDKWHYRLNSLLVRAIKAGDGTLPVLNALNHLFQDSRGSFILTSCKNIFDKKRKRDKPKIIGDADIFCIQNGRLIIGEVKSSQKSFDKTQIDSMVQIAKIMRPDSLIFAAPCKLPPKGNLRQTINQVASELQDLEIEVRWINTDERLEMSKMAREDLI
ncbi:MAG: hypothetical protein Q7S29_00150 [Candidatus Peribacter sp.]|nr:hypothetical protein [Candidatus Peribacter sp.]